MDLPVMPPVRPMLARSSDHIPAGYSYEAKWDGFRALVFQDGGEIEIGSRSGKPLSRYFPELPPALRERLPARCVVDGEIVVARGGILDFEALQERIHPAESRVSMLSESTPADYIAFDLLALGDRDLCAEPFTKRRRLLAEALADTTPPLHLAPATADRNLAAHWFDRFEGAGIDGIVAKDPQQHYRPGERHMVKVKHERTADCVVAGVRQHKNAPVVGSLLLGLYDNSGQLQHVGACGAFSQRRREELMAELEPLRLADPSRHPWADWRNPQAHAEQRLPGSPNRWSGGKDASWIPLRPEWVCEVAYDHLQGTRFRHTAQFRRWRPDREPHSCTYGQLDQPTGPDLRRVLSGGG